MTKDESLKLAIGKIKSARDCHFAAIDPLLFEAEEILEQALAAPVQEPVGEVNRYGLDSHGRKWHGIHWYDPNVDVAHGTKLYTAPPAQPAVPDAIIEAGESPEFRDGWNECRETILQMLKARKA
jgi:hypothetical protein